MRIVNMAAAIIVLVWCAAVAPAAEIVAFAVNEGNDNRSGIRSIDVLFDEPATVSGVEALQLFDADDNPVPLTGVTLSGNGTAHLSWTVLSLDLPDGVYTAVLSAGEVQFFGRNRGQLRKASVQGLAPQSLTEDAELLFHRLRGDVNGDGLVNFDDYFAVRDHFNTINAPPYVAGDADGDGFVNFNDYFYVRDYFNNSVE